MARRRRSKDGVHRFPSEKRVMREGKAGARAPAFPFTALNRSGLEDDLSAHLEQARLVIGGNRSKT
jgi:hypothetical protein